jgi:hypothetical protein
MRVFKYLVTVASLGVLVALIPVIAQADEWNKDTQITFSKPVEVPSTVLKAGTYEFRLLDSASDRNVVQILNADGTHLYENVLAFPAYRQVPTDKTVVTFEERAQGAPQAVATWFYPGDNTGEEFVYAKPALEALAVTPGANSNPQSPSPAKMASNVAQPRSITQQTAVAPTATGTAISESRNAPAQLTQSVRTPARVPSSAVANHSGNAVPKKLPKTASAMPLLLLAGVLSLGLSAAIRICLREPV